jgi:uncharacterized repeat protein (TIGR03833 family)
MKSILESLDFLIEESNYHHYRKNIKLGSLVSVVKKENQRNGIQHKGVVQKILTSKSTHTRGIKVKVKLRNGSVIVGRVQSLLN